MPDISTVQTDDIAPQSTDNTASAPPSGNGTPPISNETPRKKFRFTRENSRYYCARAHEARRLARKTPQKLSQTEPETPWELAIVSRAIEHLNRALASDELKPRERCMLIKALDLLINRARIIRGLPMPSTASARPPAPTLDRGADANGIHRPDHPPGHCNAGAR